MRTTLKILGLSALLVGMFVAIIFSGILGKSAGRQAGEAVFAKAPTDSEVESVLAKTANANNAELPKMIDEYIRLEREAAGPGRKYTYFFTFPGYSSTDINHAAIVAFAANLKENVCGRKGTGGFLKHGVSIIYVYSGNDAREIDRVTVTPKECGYQ